MGDFDRFDRKILHSLQDDASLSNAKPSPVFTILMGS
jgi:hypothetical protein